MQMKNRFAKLERSTMRKLAIAFVSALSIGVSGVASADENNKPSGEVDHMRMATAQVIAVDLPTRTVTLIGPAGNEFIVYVDDTVKNLPQTRVGDQVDVSYYEALVWNVKKATGGNPGVSVQGEIASATPGSKPAGTATAQMNMTATIDSIDLDNGTVTLEGPRGNTRTLTAQGVTHYLSWASE
jgi:hypothetical protein